MKRYIIIAGEASGDMYGSALMTSIKKQHQDEQVEFWGVGGDKMRKNGLFLLEHYKRISVVGFTEVVMNAPYLYRLMNRLTLFIKELNPANIILIDFPGFNLHLAKKIKKKSKVKNNISYFVSPQLWAWHENRINYIKKYIDQMLVIFPFEESFYKKYNVDAIYVGHPLLDDKKRADKNKLKRKIDLNNKKKIIGIFPGSRKSEIDRHLPIYIQSIEKLQQQNSNLEFFIGLAPNCKLDVIKKKYNLSNIKIEHKDPVRLLKHCYLAITTSGTISLQATFVGVPCIVGYKLSYVSWIIAKILIKVKYITMANIILNKQIYPELIQNNLTSKNIIKNVNKMLTNVDYYENIKNDINKIIDIFSTKDNAIESASKIIYEAQNKKN